MPRQILTVAEKRAIFTFQTTVLLGDDNDLPPTFKADNKAISQLKVAARGVYIELCVLQPNSPWSDIDTEWDRIPSGQVEQALHSIKRRHLHLIEKLELSEKVRKIICSRQYLLHELERFRDELRKQQCRRVVGVEKINEEIASTDIVDRLEQLASSFRISVEKVFERLMYGYERAEQIRENWEHLSPGFRHSQPTTQADVSIVSA